MEVRIGNTSYGQGSGTSKQAAEKAAARKALLKLGVLENV
jgi:dsRNA-specific ribonuclease